MKYKTKQVECGFDLTQIGNGEYGVKLWLEILTALGLPVKPKRVIRKMFPDSSKPFMWKREGLRIVTGNDPISGRYYAGDNARERDRGYASYIGITGTPKLVAKAARLIKSKAAVIKEFDPKRRQFI